MTDFSNLDKFKVQIKKTRRFELSNINIDGLHCVVLIGTYSGQSNHEWLTSVVKDAPNLKVFTKDERVQETEYNDMRENELIATHSINGWEHVVDADMNVLPCDPKVCLEFLEYIDAEDSARVRFFFGNRLNFMEGAGEAEAVELGNDLAIA